MSYAIAISGLYAAQTDLDATSHNIANSSTVGFKEGRAEFADVYANTIGEVEGQSTGRGVMVTGVAQQFTQGTVEFTGNSLDLAVNGEGFFVTKSPNDEIYYTRAGQFSVDQDGYVVNHAERRVQVLGVKSPDPFDIDNVEFVDSASPGALEDLKLPAEQGEPNATEEVSLAINLDSTETTPALAFDVSDPDTYNSSTSMNFYDSQGNSHIANYYFIKTADNTWDAYVQVDEGDGTFADIAGSPIELTFDSSGKLASVGGTAVDPTDPTTYQFSGEVLLNNGTNIGAYDSITNTYDDTVVLDLSSITQYGSPFSVNNLSQDGYTVGRLNGIDVEPDGGVYARYTNGQSMAMGRIALANFNNPQGLTKAGDTSWQHSAAAGEPQIGGPLTSDLGSVQSGATESSNTDLASQLVKLIIAQRNYQANAQVITTNKTLTQTILNI
jgi:flagellar hook protein FlgE